MDSYEERFAEAALADSRVLTDYQVQEMLVYAAERRDALVEAGQAWTAERMADLACALAAVRDERRQMARAVDEAEATVTPLGDTES